MRTQYDIIGQIFETAQTLERMTKPSMMPVQDYDQALAAAAHDYARRLEMQADACDPDDADPALGWNRVEHASRRLEHTLADLEQTPGNAATIGAAIALAAHCRVEATNWRAHPKGARPPLPPPGPLTNAEGKPWHQVAAERKAAEAEAAAPE